MEKKTIVEMLQSLRVEESGDIFLSPEWGESLWHSRGVWSPRQYGGAGAGKSLWWINGRIMDERAELWIWTMWHAEWQSLYPVLRISCITYSKSDCDKMPSSYDSSPLISTFDGGWCIYRPFNCDAVNYSCFYTSAKTANVVKRFTRGFTYM